MKFHKAKFLFLFIAMSLLLLALASCAQPAPASQPAATGPAETQPVPATATPLTEIPTVPPAIAPIDLAALKDLDYRLGILAETMPETNGQFKLTDGVFEKSTENPPVRVSVHLVQNAAGDLNGDGSQDAAVILAVNTGGSGTFIHLVGVLDQQGKLVQAAELFIEDRASIKSISIADGKVTLDMTVHKADDPLCCPSLETTKVYRLQGNEWKEES